LKQTRLTEEETTADPLSDISDPKSSDIQTVGCNSPSTKWRKSSPSCFLVYSSDSENVSKYGH
jgi:hypothetical protein